MKENYGTGTGPTFRIDKFHTKSIIPYKMELMLLKHVDIFCIENKIDELVKNELRYVILDIADKEFLEVCERVKQKGIICGLGDNLPPRVLKLIEDDIIRNTAG